MTTNEPQAAAQSRKPRRYCIKPDRLILGLLIFEGLLLLSERLDCFSFNHQTWSVLIAFASVALAVVLLLLWFAVALFFHWQFQYGVRSLTLLLVAVAIPCSWLAVEMGQERKQRVAADEICALGGSSVQSEPTWLGKLLRDNSLVSVTHVELSGTPAIDAGLAHCEELHQLRLIEIVLGEVADTGLAHLEGLSQLQVLIFSKTQVTHTGLTHLQGLSQLKILVFFDTNVSDAGLAHLQGLSQLQEIWLSGTNVTNEGVKKLQQALPNCKIEH